MGILRRRRDGKPALLPPDSLVGRLETCSLRLEHSFVSTTHALIRWGGNGWTLRDLGSTNGTYLDGSRIPAGAIKKLTRGVAIGFGGRDELWDLTDDSAPLPAVIPLDGGEACCLTGNFIGIPSQDHPLATVFLDGDSWFLETEETKTRLNPSEVFHVLGSRWRLECPSGSTGTVSATERSIGLDESTLLFSVSSDEEHVVLAVNASGDVRTLGERTCFYLGLVLARQFARDLAEGASEPGWVDINDLLRMIPDYGSYAHLNVDIFRLREALFEAGIHDANRVVETRRGQRRLGTARFELRRAG